MVSEGTTTIKVSVEAWRKINSMKIKPGETPQDIVDKLLNVNQDKK